MKSSLNAQINSLPIINEINLFRTMAMLFNSNNSRSTFVKETHSHKGFIDYYSSLLGSIKKIEIADLLFITFNKSKQETRICFLQAKYKKRKYKKFLSFPGNIFQWELLNKKPNIIDSYNIGYPTNILNFSSYDSITSFGIFYYDVHGKIDFLYTLPRHINPKNHNKITSMYFNGPCICPNVNCIAGLMPRETISTCSIDIFEREILQGRIGAPIDSKISSFFYNLIKTMQLNEPNNEIVNNLIHILDINRNSYEEVRYYPNTIIVITEGEKTPKNFV